jgi:hypothetical protein
MYLAYGIGGKTKLTYVEPLYGLAFYRNEVVNSFGYDSFKNFDFGFRLGVGATFYKIYLGLAYDISTADIGKGYYDGYTIKNKSFSINIGYSLLSSKKLKNDFNRIYPLDK